MSPQSSLSCPHRKESKGCVGQSRLCACAAALLEQGVLALESSSNGNSSPSAMEGAAPSHPALLSLAASKRALFCTGLCALNPFALKLIN